MPTWGAFFIMSLLGTPAPYNMAYILNIGISYPELCFDTSPYP